ncbi:TFIIB-type zinc ribbon-containing protein [Latilactobacillus curvatus]|uniref:TFIIB-type zinc ribbon-containing protein n=1 Tax=Latilactobacillus curvatus TaxID=28038 RepID=UPI0021A6B7EB|nr:TFIIB-type zinc ribbon-containing protein [Latilactobacillus curvatus]MCT3533203.1 TFIIB-type zinc ribbon-containing protein [Latilactobacillus curvatus]
MVADTTFNISIPSDSDGFVFLQCSLCGEFFKITPSDLEDESQLHIWCPKCGLTPDSLITDEVRELAMRIVNNHVSDLLNDFGKNLSKSLKNGKIKFKPGSKIKKDAADPIVSKLDNLEPRIYECCHKEAKISPSLKTEGGYCPFCGEMQDGD